MGAPATLPADFFEKAQGTASPPQTLPADFDFEKGAAPKTDVSPMRGASQATGLGPDTRTAAGKIWDEVKRGLTSAQAGQGLKPQPTTTANVAQFAGMMGDTLAQFGIAQPAAEGAGAAEHAVRGFLKPTTKTVPEVMNLLGPTGKPLIKMVEQQGPSMADTALEKLNKASLVKLIKKAVAAYGGYEAAKKLGIPLP